MARQVVIVHGWSDTSQSFRSLAAFLAGNGYEPKVIWLGDYISKDDDVRIEDVGKRMGEVIDDMLQSKALDTSFDVIVHSTGGLVVREWLTTRYKGAADKCPMKRLVMLAPANYGSKLAAMGKSLLGRVVKGYDNWFHSGQSMLNDLELSSAYQWELAQRDTLIAPGGDTTKYYGDDRVWPFVIVGTHPYASALRQIVNENGSDGTVRVCAANLNARGVTLDFGPNAPMPVALWASRLEADVPLAVLPTRTHGSIIDPDRASRDGREDIAETNEEKQQLGALILQALACKDFDTYRTVIQPAWDTLTEATALRRQNPPKGDAADYYHQYMQLNSYVVDDHGRDVTDYFLEFFSDRSKRNDDANVYLHARVIEDVKKNSQNESLRNLLFDRTDLMENYYNLLPKGIAPILYLSISAAAPGRNITYFERENPAAEQQVPVHLEGTQTKRWLARNTTHFARIIIPRMPRSAVFKLTNFADA